MSFRDRFNEWWHERFVLTLAYLGISDANGVNGGANLLTFNGVPVGGKTVVDPKVVKLH